ncbi:MAG: hypothetical protein ACXVA9_00600 [Bdellovibrionales bacterium]
MRFVFSSIVLAITSLMVTESGAAAPQAAPKSFAVFVAFYNTHNDIIRGGVCGTVFFVSPTQAITAHHVLRASSFKPANGFERVRVWLVHEDYRAIEMKPEFVTSNPDKDITTIKIPVELAVDRRFVFPRATKLAAGPTPVETDGFIANTAGPTLERQGLDVNIVKVSSLTRLHLSGTLVRSAVVNLKAADIDLKSSPNYELSYQPVVGISGGPVTSGGKVIAMNSFADPGTRKHTWALQLVGASSGLARP